MSAQSAVRPPGVSEIFYGSESVLLLGYPSLELVSTLTDAPAEVFEQKLKPTINTFKLLPRAGLKAMGKLSSALAENLGLLADQFEYEDQMETASNHRKKGSSKQIEAQTTVVKRHPLYRILSPANPVLREEYSVFSPESLRKLASKQQEDVVREKLKAWIDIGYHAHVVQAFKLQINAGRTLIFLEKLKTKTLRDWLMGDFFADKNRHLNSKRVLNCLLQLAVGLNYIHKRRQVHQCFIPDHVFVENDKVLKISNLCSINMLTNKLGKGYLAGGSPEYWSPEQAASYETALNSSINGGFQSGLRLLPSITYASDIYQLGLIALELLWGRRLWVRGDRINLEQIKNEANTSNVTKEVATFVIEKAYELLETRPQRRQTLKTFICSILETYAKLFKNAQDLLWCKFFNEEKYESDLLNNKAVGLYLSGNEADCDKSWTKSVTSNPGNLVAVYNHSHFKRMKRLIDDRRLSKDLCLQPQSRKRNYYLLISNLTMLPLLKEPFKTYNFNPRLSKHKEIETISRIIEVLDKNKRPPNYCYQRRHQLIGCRFQQVQVVSNSNGQFLYGRLKNSNMFRIFALINDMRSYDYSSFGSPKPAAPSESRHFHSIVDSTSTYFAFSQNSAVWIYLVTSPKNPVLHYQIQDYGSAITTLNFDLKSEVLGVGSNQFTVKLVDLVGKTVCKTINVGQKFVIRNLQYYDRNTCISYSYEKSICFHRIETGKQLFIIRSNATIINYRILEASVNSHVLIVHTVEKFEIWNLKDKALLRNIEIDEAPKIQGFFANSTKKLVVHYTANAIRIWNYSNGLILKTYRTPITQTWVHIDSQFKTLRSLDSDGNLVVRMVDFTDFIKHFEGVCVPNEICITDQNDTNSDSVAQYVGLGKELVANLNEYRINEQEKKVALEKMYKIAESIKSTLFFQDKTDIKAVFTYLNGIRQSQDKSSRINAHSEEYVFTSRQEDFITATSSTCDGHWLIGDSSGTVRLVTAPNKVVLTIRPKQAPVCYLNLQAATIFIGYASACILLDREELKVVVSHSAYHKKPIRMGLIVNSVLVTGDQDEVVLFWNKQKIKRYDIPVALGQAIGRRLLVAGFDNRIRMYDVHSQNGLQTVHVFIGHVLNVYRLQSISDSIFVSASYDGTVRWWNTQAKTCFNFYNLGRCVPNEKVLYSDLPKASLEDQRQGRFDREGCALLLVNHSQVVVLDLMRKEVKWSYQFPEEVTRVFWVQYPHSFAAVTHEEVVILKVYWRYTVLKKQEQLESSARG